MIIHLNIHSSESLPISFYDDVIPIEDISIKVSNIGCPVVKCYSEKGYSVGEQHEHGVPFLNDIFITYESIVENLNTVFPKIEIFSCGKCVGHANITPNQFVESCGAIRTVLTKPATNEVVADLLVHYVLIKSWRNQSLSTVAEKCNFDAVFLYVGHRGCGKTLSRDDTILENTIESFSSAHKMGASFVELDIQMTKDLVPLVFHDFQASIFPRPNDDTLEYAQVVEVKDFTAAELRKLKVDFARQDSGSNHSALYASLFPTLYHVLRGLPLTLGLMIEVKYPYQDRETGQWEVNHYPDREVIVHAILDVVFAYDEDRPIVFCSFDADICLMLQFKQMRFPVVFITSGENDSYHYMDIRNRTRMIAANFALTYGLMGISVYSDPLFKKSDEFIHLVTTMKKSNKHVFSWGSKNSELDFVDFQKRIGVTGVITDKLSSLSIDVKSKSENK